MNNKRSNQYVVYDKEENLIMVGNSAEITEKLGITIGTFYSYVSRGDSSKVIIESILSKRNNNNL